MKTFSYKVTIKTVKGSELSVPHEEHVPVLQPETLADLETLAGMDEYGIESVCKAVFESLKLRANAMVRRRLENLDSPKAGRAMAQAWIMSGEGGQEQKDKLIGLFAGMSDTEPYLNAMYENHGEAIRDWNREKSNTFNQRP